MLLGCACALLEVSSCCHLLLLGPDMDHSSLPASSFNVMIVNCCYIVQLL